MTKSNHPDFASGSLSVLLSYTLFDKYTLTCLHKYRIAILHSRSFLFLVFCLSSDPTSDTLWTPYHVCVLPFPNAMQLESYSKKPFAAWLHLLRSGHLCFLHSFLGSISHFFLTLNNILLSGCTTVYLSIHLLKIIS